MVLNARQQAFVHWLFSILNIIYILETLISAVMQLFIGGFDTTTTTLTWALLFLVNYPSTQQKLYDEINHVIGELSLLKLLLVSYFLFFYR